MIPTGHYFTVTHPDGRIGIRYQPAERTLTAESVAHRERQSLRPVPVAGRVQRIDRGAIRVRARLAVSA